MPALESAAAPRKGRVLSSYGRAIDGLRVFEDRLRSEPPIVRGVKHDRPPQRTAAYRGFHIEPTSVLRQLIAAYLLEGRR